MKKFIIIPLALLLFACGPKKEDKKINNEDSLIENMGKTDSTESVETIASAPINLNKSDFLANVHNYTINQDWKYEGDLPCIVDFYADWCAPCRAIAPIMEEIAKQYSGKLYVYKVNVDYEPELSSVYGVQGIPAVMFCPMDGDFQMKVGSMPKAEYIRLVNEVLKVS